MKLVPRFLALLVFLVFAVLLDQGRPVVAASNIDQAEIYIVNSTQDTLDGACNESNCTLREAILAANAHQGVDSITFDLGSGVPTIRVGGSEGTTAGLPLPQITDPLYLDGNTGGAERVELNGEMVASDAGARGLWITAGNTEIHSLVINRFKGTAIRITDGGYNWIEDNYLGTDSSGTVALGNGAGIVITRMSEGAGYSAYNLIGGIGSEARNVISGNDSSIVIDYNCDCYFEGNNRIQSNFIGTDASGETALGNGYGIVIRAANNTIGGVDKRFGNVISGNDGVGIFIDGPYSTGNIVQGNRIGTDVTGMVALGNKYAGLLLMRGPNLIGGTGSGEGNVISENRHGGIELVGKDIVVQGNRIGTDVTGTLALGNRGDGVFIARGASGAIVGGTVAGARNIISGNHANGIRILRGDASVRGNFIGTGVTGKLALGNQRNGVLVRDFANNHSASIRLAQNRIAFNVKDGVHVSVINATAILRNAIFSNGELGIALAGGGNNNATPPILDSVSIEPNSVNVLGRLDSIPNQEHRIEFFAAPACDASGAGEGKRYLGLAKVTTDENGKAVFDLVLHRNPKSNRVFTATATDALGNTSEFSGCKQAGSGVRIELTRAT